VVLKPGWRIKLKINNKNKIVPGHNALEVVGYIYGNEEQGR
jgi:hypothetical protein